MNISESKALDKWFLKKLNSVSAIHIITVAKIQMYRQGVKSITFGVKGQSWSKTFYSHELECKE